MQFKHLILAGMLALGFAACSDDKDEPGPVWGDGITVKSEVSLNGANAQTLNIKAPSVPTVTADAAWLHIGAPEAKAAGIYAVSLQADINPAGEPRTATLSITAGQHKATVTVTQHAGEVLNIISVEPSATLNPAGGKLTVTYTATSPVTVAVPEWMTYNVNDDNTALTVSYTGNTGAERTGEIVIAINDDVREIITVTQGTADALAGKTAKEIIAAMYAGVNIGNTLEAPGSETAWVKTKVSQEYINGLLEQGFNAVRIPCAWDSHVSDAATNTIDPAWLDRVDEVVGYIVGNGMYAVLNIHWDGGWLENTVKDGYDEAVNKKQHDYWKQIAEKLNHYDQHLLFAAMNEPNHSSDVSTDAIMRYQQTMLDVVRATGGNNADRVLLMQGPNTNIDITTAGRFHMPDDVVADRLGVEVHYYDTYQFNMMEEDASWGKMHYYWGAANLLPGSDRNSNHDEADVRASMQKMKTAFADKGIPGIIGEYCVCANRENYKDIDADRWRASVRLWNKAVTREAKNAGMAPFFWETGGDINRTNGKPTRTLQLDGLFEGAAEGKYPF